MTHRGPLCRRQRARLARLAACTPIVLLALLAAAEPAAQGSPRVAFGSRRDGGPPEIWVMRSDGREQTRLTDSPGEAVNGQPAWSPDGRRIAFVSSRTGNRELFVMRADGSEPAALTSHPAVDEGPAWSPDGRSLAFHTDRDGDFEIYRLDVATGEVTRLTTRAGADKFPDWSPDGRRIVFQSDGDVHVLDVRTGAVARLTTAPELDDMPAWSPDGRRIAFMSRRDGYAAVYVVSADGGAETNLTPKPEGIDAEDWVSMWPGWSRDGRSIYFQGTRPETGRDVEIFVMRADGGRVTRLTTAPGIDSAPVER